MIKILKFGSDPEFLLRNKYTMEMVSSLGLIPGTKEEPVTTEDLGEGYTIQVDNVLGEISVAPSETPDGLWDNIQLALNYIKTNILPEYVEIIHESSGTYSEEQLNNPIAQLFGCHISLNSWSEDINEAPEPGDIKYRGCGTHIHVSYEDPSESKNFALGRAFDLFCTVPSVLLDDDTNRRQFYGRAGEIRHCSYGVELRTLGGFLLKDKSLYDYMMQNLLLAVDFVNNKGEISDELAVGIQLAINNQDKRVAQMVMSEMNIPAYQLIKA